MKNKNIIAIIFFVLTKTVSICQVDIKSEIARYKIDTIGYSLVTYTFSNYSKDSCLLWFDKRNIENLDNNKKVNSFFLQKYGDFNLIELVSNDLMKPNQLLSIYQTFLKIIPPNDNFKVSFIFTESQKLNFKQIDNFVKCHLVVIGVGEVKFIQMLNNFNYPFYRGKDLVIKGSELIF